MEKQLTVSASTWQTGDPDVKLPPWPVRAACRPFADVPSANSSANSPEIADEALLRAVGASASVLYNASGKFTCLQLPDDPEYDGIWDYQ